MKRKKCPFCGLINFSTDTVCKRCQGDLVENVLEDTKADTKFGIPTFTINECGINLIDYQEIQLGYFEVMKWIVFLGVPIIPLSSWIIQPKEFENEIPGTYGRYNYNVISRVNLKFNRVFRILGINLISIIPMIIVVFLFDTFDKIFGSDWGMLTTVSSFLFSILWLIGIHWRYTDNGDNKYILKTSTFVD